MSNPYAEVIDLLNTGGVDYRRIAIELAKTSPSLFLRLHRGKPTATTERLLPVAVVREIRNLVSQKNNKVAAIKALRVATQNMMNPHGISLKDAKDVIDSLSEEMTDNQLSRFLNEDLIGYFNEIKG